jgi:large conductance mechanosensitive channel
MLEEFKKFALRGNVVDLAIGVIIGAAFGKIVDSIVGDIFMPIIGAVAGGLDFSNYFLPLSANVTAQSLDQAKAQGAVIAWGSFITISINFIIIAWILFLVVKGQGRNREGSGDPGQREAPGRNPRSPETAADRLISAIRCRLPDSSPPDSSPVSIDPFASFHGWPLRLALGRGTRHGCSPARRIVCP